MPDFPGCPFPPVGSSGKLRAMGKPGSLRACVAGVHAWLDARVDYERTPPVTPPGAAFGLGRMRRLLAAIGNPHHALPVVHVAGTKGKGSTVAMLSAILEEAGLRTGRYVSPHVHGVEERISINGLAISPADLVAAADVVRPAVASLDEAAARAGAAGPTWFEIVTALGIVHFVRSQVDIAVLETGLGGRLDATNVSRPLVSVITSISFDHMGLLGRTIGRITAEKAGIIKRGCPVVSGVSQPVARRVVSETARRCRARLVQLDRDFTATYEPASVVAGPLTPGYVVVGGRGFSRIAGPARYRINMAGRHQADNAALAVVAAHELGSRGITIPNDAIARGLARAYLPARIEVVAKRPLVVVDGAHNVASMKSLLETVGPVLMLHRPRVLLFAASRDKQIEEMLAVASGGFDRVVLTRYTKNLRGAGLDRLKAACRLAKLPAPDIAESPVVGLRLARRIAGREGSVVVAGSFFLAAELGLTSSPTARSEGRCD